MESLPEDPEGERGLVGDDPVPEEAQSVHAVAETPQRFAAARRPVSVRHSGAPQIRARRVRFGWKSEPQIRHRAAFTFARVPSRWSAFT